MVMMSWLDRIEMGEVDRYPDGGREIFDARK